MYRTIIRRSYIYTLLLMMLLASSCIRMPKTYIYSEVKYTFDGGDDLLSIFNLTAFYMNSNLEMVSSPVTSLPWTITENIPISLPVEARLDISFSAKDVILSSEFYNVGFSSDISYKNTPSFLPPSSFTYTKAEEENYETLSFLIPFNTPEEADNALLTIPNLKYNKHFLYSYTADDAVVGAYARLWRRINKKWIDDIEFFHKQCTKSTGYYPDNTLGMTDGCGNERRFPVGVAIWPNIYSSYMPDGIMYDSSSSIYLPYITWDEMESIVDFGGAAFYHNVDEQRYDKTNPSEIADGMEDDRVKTLAKLNRDMKILAQPDGNASYLEAAGIFNKISMIRSDHHTSKIYVNSLTSLSDRYLYSGFTEDRDGQIEEMESQSSSDNPYWISFSTHRVDTTVISLFEKINDLYGKDGKDNLWFATIEEVYEYATMRENAVIEKEVIGSNAVFTVTVPKYDNFYYKDLSFIIDGVNSKYQSQSVSDNIIGIFSNVDDGKLLINVNFNAHYPDLAEKYTSIYEKSFLEEDKNDALYFTSFLSEEKAAQFLERLNNAENGIRLHSMVINGGSKYTYSHDISINLEYDNIPTEYKIWEKDEQKDDKPWHTFTSDTIKFHLSDGFGTKRINAALRNQINESKTVSSSIEIKELGENTILKEDLNSYIEKYNGYTHSTSITIPAK